MKTIAIRFIAIISLLCIGVSPASATFPGEFNTEEFDFTVPTGLEDRVVFWKKVYTQYSTQHAIIHDQNNLEIIYDVVYLGDKNLSARALEQADAPARPGLGLELRAPDAIGQEVPGHPPALKKFVGHPDPLVAPPWAASVP